MTSAISSIERMISKFVTINACQEVFVFNDKGPVSSALNVDIAVNTTLGEIYSEATSGVSSAESIPDGYSSAKEAVSFKFAYNMMLFVAFDVNRMVAIAQKGMATTNTALYCAFQLYGDFIVLFIRILYLLLATQSRK